MNFHIKQRTSINPDNSIHEAFSNVIANRWWKHLSTQKEMKRKCLALLQRWKKIKRLLKRKLLMNGTTSYFPSPALSRFKLDNSSSLSIQSFSLALSRDQILSLLISISALIVKEIKNWKALIYKGAVIQTCSRLDKLDYIFAHLSSISAFPHFRELFVISEWKEFRILKYFPLFEGKQMSGRWGIG